MFVFEFSSPISILCHKITNIEDFNGEQQQNKTNIQWHRISHLTTLKVEIIIIKYLKGNKNKQLVGLYRLNEKKTRVCNYIP